MDDRLEGAATADRMFDLTGTVAVVTGGTGHLGIAICEGFAECGAGVAVCSTALSRATDLTNRLRSEHSIPAAGFEVDLREPEAPGKLVSKIRQKLGRIDCLVNNAFYGSANSLEDMTPQEWVEGLEGTVSLAMRMIQACIAPLQETRGNVVNIASMYGMISPDPALYAGGRVANPPSYGAGKAALLQLTRFAAVHLAPRGIRVNAISPGAFPSEAVQQDREFVERLSARVPLRRIGRPFELKGAAVFLASPAASYITGHNLVVDGGWTVW